MRFIHYTIIACSLMFGGILALPIMAIIGIDSFFAFIIIIPIIIGVGMLVGSMGLPLDFFEEDSNV